MSDVLLLLDPMWNLDLNVEKLITMSLLYITIDIHKHTCFITTLSLFPHSMRLRESKLSSQGKIITLKIISSELIPPRPVNILIPW